MSSLDRQPAPGAPVRYRVEHREGGVSRSLGELVGVPPHHATLVPYVTALLLAGEAGEVVLIDEASRRVVARRRVRPSGAQARDRFRELGN